MSLKTQFLKKLQDRQRGPVSFTCKTQADIAAFRLRMTQLQEQMDIWLTDTGLHVETQVVSVTDLLVGGGAFEIASIVLHIDNRSVNFVPVFLYGQGVTGCVEVTFRDGVQVTPLGRLFMRSVSVNDWTFAPSGDLSRSGEGFNESTFFSLIIALLQ